MLSDTQSISSRHVFAQTLAVEAGAIAQEFFLNRDELVIEDKANPQDIVSRADREVEMFIRDRLTEMFPDDGVLGEEYGSTEGTSGFLWVIDPIDGTSLFLAGLAHWCVSIAVCKDMITVSGVIHAPQYQETFSAQLGEGAYLNDKRLQPNTRLTMNNSLIGVGVSARGNMTWSVDLIQRLLASGGMYYRNGSGALMLASVAAGRLGGYYENHIQPWDCLAGLLLVDEAGGVTAPYCKDRPFSKGDHIIAAAPNVWDALQKMATEVESIKHSPL